MSESPNMSPSTSEPENDAPVAPLLPGTPITPTAPDSPDSPKPVASVGGHKKITGKALILGLVFILLLGAVGYGAFNYGKTKAKTKIVNTTATPKPISLPPQAIVTSECTPGRGKQYIIPKDIPGGPIYDVQNDKVIAIEYVLGLKALFSDSDSFSTAILSLAKNYPVDHFSFVPAQPKQGDKDQYVHLIMFVVPKKEAASITCGSSNTQQQSSTNPTSNPSSNSSNTSNNSTRTTPTTPSNEN